MTPEQKAKEIVEKYLPLANGSINQHIMDLYNKSLGEGKKSFKDLALYSRKYHAKGCAIHEIKSVIKQINYCLLLYSKNKNNTCSNLLKIKLSEYEQVLTEIEKL